MTDLSNDSAVPGGNATLHLENPGFHAEIHAKPDETPQESKRLRLHTLAQSLNRLSKLQKSLIEAAYRSYCDNPKLAPAGTASQHGHVPHEQAPSIGIAHLYSTHAVAAYLGVQPRRSREHYCGNENQFRIKGNGWGRLVDSKAYATAQAAISRAFRRLAARGLAEKEERGFMYAGGIQLTEKGIALGRELTRIEPVPRNWTAKRTTTEGCQP